MHAQLGFLSEETNWVTHYYIRQCMKHGRAKSIHVSQPATLATRVHHHEEESN